MEKVWVRPLVVMALMVLGLFYLMFITGCATVQPCGFVNCNDLRGERQAAADQRAISRSEIEMYEMQKDLEQITEDTLDGEIHLLMEPKGVGNGQEK